ncbi:hypothetical protein ACQR3P_01575 [Rhodococcus sp. IEGM1300]
MNINENAPGNMSQKGVSGGTDNETGFDSGRDKKQTPLQADDDAAIDEDMSDVEANNSVSSEHPES